MPKEDYRVSNLYKKNVGDSPSAEKKERFSNTPSWLSPEEKAKLKLRLVRAKQLEQRTGLKEDVKLLKSPEKGSIESSVSTTESTGSKEQKSSKGKKDDVGEKKGESAKKKDEDSASAMSKDSAISKDKKKDKSKKGEELPTIASSTESSKSKQKETPSKKKEEKTKEDTKLKAYRSKENNKSTEDEKSPKSKKFKKTENKSDAAKPAAKLTDEKPPIDPSGNTMEPQPEREIEASNLDQHLWASEFQRFDPQLYRFKSPEKLSTKNPVVAECPPFWVLLDHTIAVVWKLFCQSADRKDLGIIPLQWSMEFVRAMRDERGEHLPAIARILGAIEDALIDRYAKVADKAIADKQKDVDPDKSQEPAEPAEIYYASSDSFFKYRAEVSYTLKDIMARNMPGRRAAENGEDGVRPKDAVVSKVDIPPPDDPKMNNVDLLAYLRQMKKEQEARICKEKEHSEKIDALMDLIAKGKIDGNMWLAGHDAQQERVSFDENDDIYGDTDGERSRQKGDDTRISTESFLSAESTASLDGPASKKDKKKKKTFKQKVKEIPEKVGRTLSHSSRGSESSKASKKSKESRVSKGEKESKKEQPKPAGEPEEPKPPEPAPEDGSENPKTPKGSTESQPPQN